MILNPKFVSVADQVDSVYSTISERVQHDVNRTKDGLISVYEGSPDSVKYAVSQMYEADQYIETSLYPAYKRDILTALAINMALSIAAPLFVSEFLRMIGIEKAGIVKRSITSLFQSKFYKGHTRGVLSQMQRIGAKGLSPLTRKVLLSSGPLYVTSKDYVYYKTMQAKVFVKENSHVISSERAKEIARNAIYGSIYGVGFMTGVVQEIRRRATGLDHH
eukprot:TRINITY_DN4913_c0_g1_i1.p1 TRINITY_DN4913_c0_g1~~TRINITY_DN4913_c0_g1_i1.p1  ORF type:complete len:226 (-),score=26.62 TRINITY_DN4913_c0_g1_i1:66-722(-)